MKTYLFLTIFLSFTLSGFAQSFTPLDRSPMDMAYFPDNFAHDRKEGDQPVLRVTYSRPQKKGRDLFGALVPYNRVWRTGANETPEIRVYQTIRVEGKTLEPGTYALLTIPGPDEWDIIFNRDLDYWGAYRYQEDQDVLRVKADAGTMEGYAEYFTIQFESAGENKGKMMLAWGNTVVELPFEVRP